MAAMRRESFPVEGPVALVVRAPAGVVEIEAGDVSEATVELMAERESAEGPVQDAVIELRPGSDRPELLVDIQHGFRFGGRRGPRLSIVFGSGPSVRAVIRVPAGSSVEVSSEAADVTGTGRFDRADVKSAAGDVRLDEVEGDVQVKCVAGDVTLGSIGGAGERQLRVRRRERRQGRRSGRLPDGLRRHRAARGRELRAGEDDLR